MGCIIFKLSCNFYGGSGGDINLDDKVIVKIGIVTTSDSRSGGSSDNHSYKHSNSSSSYGNDCIGGLCCCCCKCILFIFLLIGYPINFIFYYIGLIILSIFILVFWLFYFFPLFISFFFEKIKCCQIPHGNTQICEISYSYYCEKNKKPLIFALLLKLFLLILTCSICYIIIEKENNKYKTEEENSVDNNKNETLIIDVCSYYSLNYCLKCIEGYYLYKGKCLNYSMKAVYRFNEIGEHPNENIKIINSQYLNMILKYRIEKEYVAPFSLFNVSKAINNSLIIYFYFLPRNITYLSYLFKDIKFLSEIKFNDFINNYNKIYNIEGMFSGCTNLTSVNIHSLNFSEIKFMGYLFNECLNLNYIHFSKFNIQNALDMSHMFSSCYSLTSIDFPKVNSNNRKDMSYMFYNCINLKFFDISKFNTTIVNMNNMFNGCKSLISINNTKLNNFDIEDMSYMFYNCSSLKYIDISNFNTFKVKNMSSMFQGCNSLISINISKINTYNVEDMSNMFYNCTSLISVDISNLNNYNL